MSVAQVVAAVSIAAMVAVPVNAAGWAPLGVFGGDVRALAIDPVNPSILYAGARGVWKTVNGGTRWELASSGGLEDRRVIAIAIDPGDPDVLLASSESSGVFRSTDGGESWTPANQGLDDIVYSLAFDPDTPGTAYAGTRSRGIYKTTDAGASSWSPAKTGLPQREVLALAIDPNRPARIFAALDDAGVYYTTNGGVKWKKATAGLPAGLDPVWVAVAPNGTSESHVVVAEGRAFWSAKLLSTAPQAVPSFKKFPKTLPAAAQAAEFLPGVNVFISTIIYGNPGGNFGIGIGSAAGEREAAVPSLQVFAAAEDGVFLTQDSGKSWTGLTAGLVLRGATSLAYDSRSPAVLYAGTNGSGVFRNPSGQPPWRAVNNGLRAATVRDLSVAAGTGKVLYAATDGDGVLKSINSGKTWKSLRGGFPAGEYVEAVATHPTVANVVYAGTISSKVWKSVNGGQSWTSASNGIASPCIFDLAIDPSAANTLYAGSCGGGVYKTTNGGAAWTQKNSGLSTSYIASLAVAPSAPQTIYAATNNAGVFKTTNGGTTWSSANGSPGLSQFANVTGLWVHPTNPNLALASVSLGVFRTLDGGATWTKVSGLTHANGWPEAVVSSFASDPTAPDTVYAAAEVQSGIDQIWGVFKSTNGGASWTALSTTDLDTQRPLVVVVDPKSPGSLYIGTDGRGAFRFTP